MNCSMHQADMLFNAWTFHDNPLPTEDTVVLQTTESRLVTETTESRLVTESGLPVFQDVRSCRLKAASCTKPSQLWALPF